MAQRFYWKQYVTDKQVTFYIADLILKPGEQIEAHCHDYYEFFVVLKGTFLERCNGQELVAAGYYVQTDESSENGTYLPEC